jgi:hypothetical protein
MGKKEWKKWAKTVKKTAHVHRKAAETYARSATGLGTEAGAAAAGTSGGDNQARAPPPFDFTQAASQIQEFLNAVGKYFPVVASFILIVVTQSPRKALIIICALNDRCSN